MPPFQPRGRQDGLKSDDIAMEPLRHVPLPEPDYDNEKDFDSYTDAKRPASLLQQQYAVPPTYSSAAYQQPPYASYKKSSKSRTRQLLLVIQLFALIASFASIGIAATSLQLYSSTMNEHIVRENGLVMRAWPMQGLDLTTTYLFLSAAATSAVFSMVALFAAYRLERNHSGGKALSAIAALMPLIIAFLVVAVVFFRIWNPSGSLYGWSCEHRSSEVLLDGNDIGLGRVCDAMIAGWATAMLIALLEIVTFIVLIFGILKSRNQRPHRGYAFQRTGYNKVEEPVMEEGAGMIQRPHSR